MTLFGVCDDCGYADGGHAPTCPRGNAMTEYERLRAQKDAILAKNKARGDALMKQLEGTLMGKLRETEAERDQLRAVAKAARDTLTVIDEWLGMASTREAALDSMRRLERMLSVVGFEYTWKGILDWRGSLIDELWQARFYAGRDGHWHHVPGVPGEPDPVFGNAEGPELAEIVGLLDLADRRARDLEARLTICQQELHAMQVRQP